MGKIKKYYKKGVITLLGVASIISGLQFGYKASEYLENRFSKTPEIIRNYNNAYKQSPLEILTEVGNTTMGKIESAIKPKPTGCDIFSKEWEYHKEIGKFTKLIYCVEKKDGNLSLLFTFQ